MVTLLDKGKAWEEKQALTQKAIAAAQRIADVAGEAPGQLTEAGRQAKIGIRQRAAQGMAGAMGQAGRMVTGGGQASSLRQAAMQAAGLEGEFGLGQAQRMIEAKQEAAVTGLEALKFKADAGDVWDTRKSDINFFTTELTKMKLSGMSFNDIKAVIDSWIEAEGDPILVNWLQRARLSTFAGHRRSMEGETWDKGGWPAGIGVTEEQMALYDGETT